MTDWFTNTDPMNLVIEGLYLGNYLAASDKKLLQKHGITHILRVVREDVGDVFPSDFTYKFLELRDIPEQDIKEHFKEAHDFIDSALRGSKDLMSQNKVLVHCHAGVSRSATIVISYLMKRYINFSFKEAFKFVKSKRSIIHPNSGFVKQLKEYEKQLKMKLLHSDSLSSFTSRVSQYNSSKDSVDLLSSKMNKLQTEKVVRTPRLEKIRYGPPAKKMSNPLPISTPFINMEKEKLASTLSQQNLFPPVPVISKGVVRTPTILSKSGLDIVARPKMAQRMSHSNPIQIHPSVYYTQNYRKSHFAKEKNSKDPFSSDYRSEKKYMTPQRTSLKAAGLDGFPDKSSYRYAPPADTQTPSWKAPGLLRIPKRTSSVANSQTFLTKSLSTRSLPKMEKKRVTFDV